MVGINSSSVVSQDNSYRPILTESEREIHELAKFVIEPHGAHGFGEVFIHSMIETIEYALGTVSNTASYLRLWALSLAHGQLAKVFFDYTVRSVLKQGLIPMFFGWYIFFAITFSVLMCMDLMEAALHCLRLHWVEFNNKFYKGGGYAFRPFGIEKLFAKN
jgi:V-type H+-transporting ATPase subunit a